MGERFDLVVVGGGVIGLACAWRVAQRGLRVCVLDAGDPGNASHAAAGMLAPASELGERARALTALSRASHAAYPAFVAELEEEAGSDLSFRLCGSLSVALDASQGAALAELHALQREDGFDTELLDGEACRALEPGLGPGVEAGILSGAEGQVDPRALVAALRSACARRGVTIEHGVRVEGAGIAGDRLLDVVTAEERYASERFVLAAGARSGAQRWLPDGLLPPVTPVKGELLRGALPKPPARLIVRGAAAYVVPRPDGRVVVGASSERAGFDSTPSEEVRAGLLASGARLLPAVAALAAVEQSVGFRPASPDGLPLIGESGLEGLLIATGHYRDGILLTPITATAIAAFVTGEPPPDEAAAADPRRFPLSP